MKKATLWIQMSATAGDEISAVAEEMIATAKRLNTGVTLEFNGISMATLGNQTAEQLVKEWNLIRSITQKKRNES